MTRAGASAALLATLLGTAPASAQPVPAQPVPAQEKKELDVTTLIKQGIAAAQEGRWEEAKERFETAWLKSNAYDVAANLAIVEEHFGNYARAAELFAFALNTFPASEPPEKKVQLQQKLEEMRPKVATLDIQVDVSACAVTVNGKVIGKTPITTEIFGTPGKQTLVFEKKGFHPESRELEVPAGKKETIVIHLRPLPKPQNEPLPMWPAAVGFGVAGAGALLGGGMLIASAVRSGDAKDFAQTCKDENNFPGCASEGQSIVDDVDTFRTISVVGFVTAGAALAFAIPYTIAAVSSHDAASTDDVAIVPVLSPDFQGAFVRSRF